MSEDFIEKYGDYDKINTSIFEHIPEPSFYNNNLIKERKTTMTDIKLSLRQTEKMEYAIGFSNYRVKKRRYEDTMIYNIIYHNIPTEEILEKSKED